jgi:hypothetical protein
MVVGGGGGGRRFLGVGGWKLLLIGYAPARGASGEEQT